MVLSPVSSGDGSADSLIPLMIGVVSGNGVAARGGSQAVSELLVSLGQFPWCDWGGGSNSGGGCG